jgi:DNA-directed RNA polymerase specialized sigma24 family protein
MNSRNFVSDQELVDRLLLNDTDAFEELYRRYWHSLYIYSLKKLLSSEDARNIVKDIYIDLWENRHNWPADFSVARHLYSAVRTAVVKCVHDKLANGEDIEMIQQHIIPGFTLESLQTARKPVSLQQPTPDKYPTVTSTHLENQKGYRYNPIDGLKWLLQIVNSKLN